MHVVAVHPEPEEIGDAALPSVVAPEPFAILKLISGLRSTATIDVMTNEAKPSQPEVDALADRIEQLLVSGLSSLRRGNAVDALLIVQEALETAQQLPTKKGPAEAGPDGV
jgi:hypothetical protein